MGNGVSGTDEGHTEEHLSQEMSSDELALNGTDLENIFVINQTSCENLYLNESISIAREYQSVGYCKPIADPVACWPPTAANTTAVIKCFAELNFIKYDDSREFPLSCYLNFIPLMISTFTLHLY